MFKPFRILLLLLSFAWAIPSAWAAPEPTLAATNLTVYVNCGQFDIVWTNGNGYQRLVLVSPNPIDPTNYPVDGMVYTPSTTYGNGTSINGAYVVWANSGSNVTVTGLINGQQYYVAVFEYNGNGGGINYLLNNVPTASGTPVGVTVSLTATKTSMCQGQSSTLTAHATAIAYTWQPLDSLVTYTDSIAVVNPSASTVYTVTVYGSNGCSSSASVSITVSPTPTVTLAPFPSTCTNAPAVTLTGGSPSGGTYSGQNVSGTTFYSSIQGTYKIYYTYSNGSGCSGMDSSTITVNPPPAVTLSSFSSKCMNVVPFALTGGNPTGGTYSGPGVTNNTFFPLSAGGAGNKTIVYTYTASNGCSNTASRTLTVVDTPMVSQSPFPSVCPDFSAFPLTGGSPAGGVYTGTGVSSGQFNPAVSGSGTFNITYRYTSTSTNCASSVTLPLTVYSRPSVTFSAPLPYCDNNGNVLLTGGSPSGGFYSGSHVSNNRFNTSSSGPGQFQVIYIYTNNDGCENSDTADIVVNAAPVVALTPLSPACLNDEPVVLNNGTPSGGLYYGDGVTSGVFSPSVADTGTGRIYYSFTDTNGCSSLDSVDVLVRPNPTVTLPAYPGRCVNIGPFPLTGGTPAGGTYFGRGIANSTFYSAVAGVGVDTVFYTYTDTNGCAGTTLSTIVVYPFPLINLGPDTTIYNDQFIVLNAGNPGSTYSWSNGETTQTLVVDTNGRGFGTFSFRVRVTNQYGCFNRDTVVVTISYLVGIDPVTGEERLVRLFPNPFADQTIIDVDNAALLHVTDAEGRLVLQKELLPGNNLIGHELRSGFYQATLTENGRRTTFRFIKQ